MAVHLNISIQEEKNSIIVNDCTGTFSIKNTGGYGTQNLRIEDITDAYIEVQPPSATEKYPFKVVTFPEFPDKDFPAYEIMPNDVGAEEIESGEWKFKMTVVFTDPKTGASSTKTAYATEVLTKNVECCIDKMTSGKLRINASNDPKQKLIIELSNLLEDVKKLIGCGQYGKANEVIEYLKSHCKCCGCH